MTGMMNRTKAYLLIGQTRTIFGWARLMTRLGPFHHWNEFLHNPLQKEMRTASGASTFTHTTTGLRLHWLVSPSKPPPGWPKGIRTNPTIHQITPPPTNPKDPNNIGLWNYKNCNHLQRGILPPYINSRVLISVLVVLESTYPHYP